MKFTAHEREIVSKINKGEIYDIPSYLRSFKKGHDRAYDMDAIRNKFTIAENGKQYKVLKDGHSLLASSGFTKDFMGHANYTPVLITRQESDITDDEWTFCEAKLVDKIPPSVFTYNEQEFKMDFQQGTFVADDFQDILTFIRLWSYLRHENLVFEVGKPVSKDEISMLYELVPCDKKKYSKKIKIERDDTSSEDDRTDTFRPVREIYQVVPTHRAEEFMDAEWKMNEDHLMMCREFLGKKMYPTEASHNFAANNYRTPDEVHRNLNSIVAVAAFLISVLTFFYGLLHPSNTYQPILDNLTKQVAEIQMALDEIENNQLSLGQMDKIYEELERIEENLSTTESNGVYSKIEELATDIEEIRSILGEQFATTDSTKE